MSTENVNGLNIVIAPGDFLCQIGPVPADSGGGGPYTLYAGSGLYSPARAIRLWGQSDGNYVLQYVETSNLPRTWPNSPLDPSEVTWVTFWATNTAYNEVGDLGPNNYLTLQDDGNFVVYDLNKAVGDVPGGAIWASNTAGNPGAFLRLQDDGNLIITAQSGQVVWTSQTSVAESRGANV